jgi:hypothetical protein
MMVDTRSSVLRCALTTVVALQCGQTIVPGQTGKLPNLDLLAMGPCRHRVVVHWQPKGMAEPGWLGRDHQVPEAMAVRLQPLREQPAQNALPWLRIQPRLQH